MDYLIDTHCHLHDREFFSDEQAEAMLKRALERDVKQIICIGTTHEDSLKAKVFAEQHENVFWTYGTHPESANSYTINCDKSNRLVAIGEIGLDYHYPGYDRDKQIKLLEESVDLALKLELPCSFHVRDAFDDFFAVIRNFLNGGELKHSVVHSFSDSEKNFWKALDKGFYIGVNGLATFTSIFDFLKFDDERNSLVLSRLLLETDAPFLTPAPNRGIINEPGNVKNVATWLSRKFNISEAEVAERTTKNARLIFNIPNPESSGGKAIA